MPVLFLDDFRGVYDPWNRLHFARWLNHGKEMRFCVSLQCELNVMRVKD